MKIEVSGGTISASIQGAGRPIVLIHSLLADKGSFAEITGALAERFTVIELDLPGFGESSFLDGDIIMISDRIAGAIAKLCTSERPIVIGNGFGAFVSLQMAIRHPLMFHRLVLADSGAKFSEPGRQAFRSMAAAAASKGLEAIADTAMRRLFSLDYQASNPTLMSERRDAFLKTNPQTFQNACADLAALDLTEEARTVTIPTLVMVGEQDEATPPAMSVELASLLPTAKFVLLKDCAHVPQLQNPEMFLAAIDDFING